MVFTTCSELVQHSVRPPAPTMTSTDSSQAPAHGAACGSQNEVILISTDSESESMSESDGETEDDVSALKNINERISKETAAQPFSASPESTIITVPNTPRALPLDSAVEDHSSAATRRSPSPRSPSPNFPATSASSRRRPKDVLDLNGRLPGISTPGLAEEHQGQTEDADEPRSSKDHSHEPGDHAELPQRTRSHGSASPNTSASIDGDGKTADDSDRDSCSDSSDQSDAENDIDDDYNDDGSSSDTNGEDGVYSQKRTTLHSPSASSFENGHAESPSPHGNIEKKTDKSCKRQKFFHDKANMPLPRLNSMPRTTKRLSRSRERPPTASMPSPPSSHSLSDMESDKNSNCSEAAVASFGEWVLHNAALKCVTIDGVATYQLQFQRSPMHPCSRRRERRPHTLVKKSKGGRKPRNETKGRRCGVCKQAGHNARTCQGDTETV